MTEAPSIFDHYPDAPGYQRRDTSRAAAEAVAPAAKSLRMRVYDAIKAKPQTTVQLSKALGLRYESVQPRTAELAAKQLIEDSGARGPSRDPRKTAVVWRVKL